MLGLSLGLGSGALYALYSVVGRAGADLGIDAWTIVAYAFGTNALTQLALIAPGPTVLETASAVTRLFALGTRLDGWLALIGLSIGPTLLGYGLYGNMQPSSFSSSRPDQSVSDGGRGPFWIVTSIALREDCYQ